MSAYAFVLIDAAGEEVRRVVAPSRADAVRVLQPTERQAVVSAASLAVARGGERPAPVAPEPTGTCTRCRVKLYGRGKYCARCVAYNAARGPQRPPRPPTGRQRQAIAQANIRRGLAHRAAKRATRQERTA